ncbi:MAG: 2-amino-4-hydroxy-6-hydroxymethyldihydropteridine diphosphokinase [Eubacteriaceae bacterium]|nr:2-amino-4-hydroxy-6-hydroxymethyldihydropteridine diphosphokinase [Eubacteriaceae bacterium]
MDCIKITDLEVYAKHGVFPEENVLGQKFLVSALLYMDLRPAAISGDLAASVDYGAVCHRIKELMEEDTCKLIETVAENIAGAILKENPLLSSASIEIKKPWAPIGLPINTVSVQIHRGWHTAYIALGSNMGDKKQYLDFAVEELGFAKGCKVGKVSSYINTAPYGYTQQDDFLNACLELKTLLSPDELLVLCHEIEGKANRKRAIHWGPRTLDLDIILYDSDIIHEPDLHIPHVEMHKRDFVLIPLNEIAPYAMHPELGKSVNALLDGLIGDG